MQPTVGPVHWAIAAGARWAYDTEPRQQLCTLGVLRTMSSAVRSNTNFAVVALALLSVCHCLRVGEAARKLTSARLADSASTTAETRADGSQQA